MYLLVLEHLSDSGYTGSRPLYLVFFAADQRDLKHWRVYHAIPRWPRLARGSHVRGHRSCEGVDSASTLAKSMNWARGVLSI